MQLLKIQQKIDSRELQSRACQSRIVAEADEDNKYGIAIASGVSGNGKFPMD